MTEQYANLRGNVSLLGQLLGKSISDHLGESFVEKIENIYYPLHVLSRIS